MHSFTVDMEELSYLKANDVSNENSMLILKKTCCPSVFLKHIVKNEFARVSQYKIYILNVYIQTGLMMKSYILFFADFYNTQINVRSSPGCVITIIETQKHTSLYKFELPWCI